MITPATHILLRAADLCRRRVTEPVALSHIVYLCLLRDIGPATVDQLHSLAGGSRDTVYSALLALESSRLVSAPRHHNRKTHRIWSLSPLGRGFLATLAPPTDQTRPARQTPPPDTSAAMNPRIPDIIDEQVAAHLLDNEGEIIERHLPDPGCRIHIDAAAMAGELARWIRASIDHNPAAQWPPSHYAELERLADYADQLRAHHLDCLDRLDPV